MIFLVPSSVADRIVGYGSSWGGIDVRVDERDGVVVLAGASKAQRMKLAVRSSWLSGHYSSAIPVSLNVGVWYRADRGLLAEGRERAQRGSALVTDTEFRPRVRSWTNPPQGAAFWVITFVADAAGASEWAGWHVDRSSAHFFPVRHVDEEEPLLAPLAPAWPLGEIATARVMLVGAGSIGSVAAEGLASYGIKKLVIVDPDHLEPHNFARHRLHPRLAGRRKASALRDQLLDRDPTLEVEAHSLDVIQGTNYVRPLVSGTDVILACTDGLASRRVVNHLAARARKPAVFACVLEDGAYGEVIRVQPERTGCLLCDRDDLLERGLLDPEPALDRHYTIGGGAHPMTAVGGDLALVGQLAAKVVVAGLLERGGDRAQALPGDALTVALRPIADILPPFDLERALEVRWRSIAPPRAGCPSCGGQ